jgi:hypothetical protein
VRIGCLLSLASCAHASFEPRIEPVEASQPTAPLVEQALLLPSSELRAVRVAEERLPEGLSFEEGELVVTDPSRYEIVGRVSTQYEMSPAVLTSMSLGFYRYDSSEAWKNPYCNVQVPLGWLTLSLWTLVPLHYPCMVAEGDTARATDGRRARILEALVRGTVASGGNLLVLTELGDLKIVTYTQFGPLLSTLPVIAGSGVAVKEKEP